MGSEGRLRILFCPYQTASTTTNTSFKCSGAGIGRLALLTALYSMDHEINLGVDTHKTSSRISSTAAGVNLWTRTWGIAKAIRLKEKLTHFLPRVPPEGERSPGKCTFAFKFSQRPANRLWFHKDSSLEFGPIDKRETLFPGHRVLNILMLHTFIALEPLLTLFTGGH